MPASLVLLGPQRMKPTLKRTLDGLRVKATPVPESDPMLPKTIVWTLTAVPSESAILLMRR